MIKVKEVFVSYTTADKEAAFSMVDYLESNGISCFIAPRDVTAGTAYASNLMKALTSCKLVLLVASHSTNESEHVLNEVDVIIDNKIDILPVFIEDFELNDDFRYYLGRKQRILAYPEKLSVYFPNILAAVEEKVPRNRKQWVETPVEPQEEGSKKTKTVFEYIPERGIMINPEDHQRNVSFRTDTLINMLGGIYEEIVSISSEEKAAGIFFNSGYVSGKNFAERIDNQWDTGTSIPEIRNKLEKWCRFDSAVGWGNFSATIDYNESDDTFLGTLKINEAFIVDKAHKRKICSFIKGYCTGVLETLIGVDVELNCKECPLTAKFRCNCVFDIVVKG